MRRRASIAALLALALASPPFASRAAAGSAAVTGVVDLAYQHAGGDAAQANAASAGLRLRFLPGRRLTACLGVDARAGVGGGGALHAATIYPIGLALRYGRTSHVSLCAGAGLSGVTGGAVPRAWTFPVELAWEGTGAFAIVRPLLVARASRVAGAGPREDGSPLFAPADEIHLAAGLRIMVPGEPLPGLSTGDGIFLGLTYDEALGDRIVGAALGYSFAAAQ